MFRLQGLPWVPALYPEHEHIHTYFTHVSITGAAQLKSGGKIRGSHCM